MRIFVDTEYLRYRRYEEQHREAVQRFQAKGEEVKIVQKTIASCKETLAPLKVGGFATACQVVRF